MRRHLKALACVGVIALAMAAPATAADSDTSATSDTSVDAFVEDSAEAIGTTIPATGSFTFTTGNGILPTWQYEDITLVGVSPGAVITTGTAAKVTLPVVAKTGSANAAGGGFRLTNTVTNASLRCSNPTIDTLARVVDCVLPDGTNAEFFAITLIKTRSRTYTTTSVTSAYRGIELRIKDQATADLMNKTLDTDSFSPSVIVATGDLVVTRDR